MRNNKNQKYIFKLIKNMNINKYFLKRKNYSLLIIKNIKLKKLAFNNKLIIKMFMI